MKMIETCLSAVGYDTTKGGAYELAWGADGIVVSLKHTAAGDTHQLEKDLGITRNWALNQWHNDLGAIVSLSKALKLQLSDCFKLDKGPFRFVMTKATFEGSIVAYTSPAAETDTPKVEIAEDGEGLMLKSRAKMKEMQARRAKENLVRHRAAKAARSSIESGTTAVFTT